MKRVLIIEDERLAAEKLERLILAARPDWQVIGAIETVEQAVKWLAVNPSPDLIMMDIQLSDGISFEIFEQVKVAVPVIFTTAFDEYAIRAFKVNSIDYLLKPIDPASLEAALSKFEQMQITQTQQAIPYETLLKLQEPAWKKRFLVKVGPAYISIATKDVELFYIASVLFKRPYKGHR
jgi:two-component system, LytTR family, response regulator LytT